MLIRPPFQQSEITTVAKKNATIRSWTNLEVPFDGLW